MVCVLELIAATGPDGTGPQLLFCENETNLARLYGAAPVTPYPKDGINDHVVHGAATVNPDQLARPDLVAAQLPGDRHARALPPVLRP